MKDLLVPVLILVLALLFGAYQVTHPDGSFGLSDGVELRDPSQAVALVNSVSPITAGNYDTFESPRGSDYQVPDGKTLYIIRLVGYPTDAAGTSEQLTIGYANDAVSNSATAPTNATVVFDITWNATDANPRSLPVFIPIPGGEYPFVLTSGAGNVQATGVLR